MDGARAERRRRVALFAFAACVFLLFQEGAITGSDGQSMYQVTRSIVERRRIDVEPAVGVPGRDGLSYSKYGIGQPLVSVVPYVVAWPVARAAGAARRDRIEQAAVSTTVPLISALLVLALYALARRLGARARPAALLSFGGVAGTYLLPYTKESFSEPLAALAIVWSIERALARRPEHAGLALALAALTRPQSFALLPVLLIALWWMGGIRHAARAIPPLLLAVALSLAYNVARFADATEFGYAADRGFSTPFPEGAAGLLGDPRKSVLLFAPILFLAPVALARLWSVNRAALALVGGNLAIGFVLSATWWDWRGGWSWGPRLVIPTIAPCVAAVAAWAGEARARRLAAAVLLVAGFVVSLPALLVSTRAQQLDGPTLVAPGVLRQYELVGTTVTYTRARLYERDEGDHRRYLSLWQVGVAGELGGKGLAASLVLSLALLGGAAGAARSAVAAGSAVPAPAPPPPPRG